MEIKEILKDYKIEKKKKTSERTEAIKEIYELYISPTQKNFRKRENWKRYVSYLKVNHIDEKKLGRTETSKLWRRKGQKELKYLKEMSAKELAIFLAPFNEKNKNLDVLYYLASVGRDMNNRNENFSSYILWSINNKSICK